ncbi:Ypt/Rab-GAP domain of gyp1p superfamily protein isoform 5 [Hibiscus syriacus]|uniref:Ypt/Rab-GAP domain of gyp1p superfamily protein isoform 5 n=1 Tax=Hibiscus syriacus TaxID=106335 RepID=A0A6A2Z2Z3_HIBSY|nr:TBC1 domain family member 15-like [Hibiscus syriacus]XP_039020323.1 TBC1 domain family member 15-like [Hibiscus syriacus]XP_039020324.1 TBC1 domain family member 15-like [Hibiscus syriacus]KAE8686107.1 Ypt/Rab-GAP domain of gyp1p superfamily protein isoform 5 [Hibiscus syriacus]
MVDWATISGIFGRNAGAEELDSFYPIRPECLADIQKTRFRPRVGKTLSSRRWHAAFSEDGHLDIEKVLRRIQRGGIHPSIKGLVWEFLLGCFDPNSTFDERNQLREQRRERYGMWKTECQKIVRVIGSGKFITEPIITDDGQPIGVVCGDVPPDVSDQKVAQWMRSLHQIGLDVVRTDRALVFYEDEANQAKLWDVLAIYSWVDADIGYVQGMNDICSPMVILLEDEADAFWCFERAMRRLRENFRCSTTSIGVQSQLGTLSQVVKTIDPKLHQHLEDLDGGEYLFAFRMLMVLFRREFSFVDALYLWEVMWAMEYNPNIFSYYEQPDAALDDEATEPIDPKTLMQYGKFQRKNVQCGHADKSSALSIFLVASVLETKNKQILKDAKGLDDVVNILGEITGNLDAKKACQKALKIQDKYLKKAKK